MFALRQAARPLSCILLLWGLSGVAGCLDADPLVGVPFGQTSDPAEPVDSGPWPAAEAAAIRPGVQVTSEGGQCTSNFLFRSPDNQTLYLGTAAHCVNAIDLGDPVEIQGATQKGKLAYSSWKALKLNCPESSSLCDPRDFALIEIDTKDRDRVHPAMLHFGGPVSLADSSQLEVGDAVLSYGHSSLRPDVDETNWHEGVVTSKEEADDTLFGIVTVAPGIFGDSGSGILTKDGKALGILSTLNLAPLPGENGVAGLHRALELAREKGDMEVQLVTWQLLDPGLLP